jgi:glycosyltransferase involved in cell wall biosynthesis
MGVSARSTSPSTAQGRNAAPLNVLTHARWLERLGGIETSTVQWSGALAARGHSVTVLHEFDGPMRADYERAGVTVRGRAKFSFAPRSAPLDLARMAPSAAWAATHRPDVVWLQRFEHVVWGQLVSRAARSPVVAHLHHMPNYQRVALLGHGVHRYLAVSDFMRQQWIDRGLPAERVVTVPNAVPEEAYPLGGPVERATARAALGVPADAFVVLNYGRLSAAKGIGVLLDAWDVAGLRSDEAHLLLVGEVDERPLVDRIDRLQQNGTATHLPTQDDVVTVLHAADLVVFPSLLAESFGRVVLESLLTGTRVLAARTGGVPEILRGEFARDLLPRGDVPALAAALREAVDHPVPGFGDRAAAWTREEFSYSRFVDRVEAELRSAAAAR